MSLRSSLLILILSWGLASCQPLGGPTAKAMGARPACPTLALM